jgi:hypothetical protein
MTREEAQANAEGRNDWFILVGNRPVRGAYSEDEAKAEIDRLVGLGRKPRLLRVVEDYEP